jgi:hypothetical protein
VEPLRRPLPRLGRGDNGRALTTRACTQTPLSGHPLCNRQAPFRLEQLGEVNFVPPAASRLPRESLPALGNLQLQRRNPAPERCGFKTMRVAACSHEPPVVKARPLYFPFPDSRNVRPLGPKPLT